MRLKRIELLGFKSFFDRTVLTFPEGITAIVGPNGCGKSNIVDAVLWALGEMRPTHLRSRSMEDVIFNGTEEVKPSGMAEVSLVFDTSLQSLRGYEGLEEVRVTRRLFRSGESHYLINRRPCRLKDIRDLFLGTGLGVNAYAVVAQGEVEALIEAPPGELRLMIEEAAGVSKYQERRKETLRKMENTRQNLERLQDVIAEVERQARSLKSQASKARRYRRLKEELRRLEIAHLAGRWRSKGQEAEGLQGEVETLRGGLTELQRRKAEAQRRKEEVGLRLLEAREDLEAVEREALKVEGELKRREERLRALEREFEGLKGLLSACKEDEERLCSLEGELRRRHQETSAEVEGLGKEVGRLEALLEQRREGLGELEPQREDLIRERDRLRKEFLSMEGERVRLGNLLKELRGRLQELEAKRERDRAELQRTEEEKRRLEEELRGLRLQEEGLQQELEGINGELEELGLSIGEQEAEMAAARQEIARLGAELEASRMRHELLLRMEEEEREGYPEVVKAILKDPKAVGLSEALVLGELIEVQRGYEEAVEAALGERIKALVVKDVEEALRVLSRVKGKVSLLPAEGPKPKGKGGNLRDFVRAEGYERLLDRLLEGVFLVDELSSANPEGEVVTRKGELVDSRGTFWGPPPSGLLRRRTSIKELEEEMARRREALQRAEGALRDLETRLGAMRQRADALRQSREAKGQRLRELQDRRHHLERDLEAAERKASLLKVELEQSKLELDEWGAEVGRTAEGLRELEGKLKGLTEELGQKEEALKGVEARKARLQREISDLREELATLRERLRGKEAGIQELAARLKRTAAQLKGKRQEAKELEGKIEDREAERMRTAEEFRELTTQQEGLSLRLEEGRQHLELLKEEEARAERALKELEAQEEEIRGRLSAKELELQRLRLEMKQLEEALRERFGLSPGEVPEEEAPEDLTDRISRLRESLERIGDVYLGAVEEYEGIKERLAFLKTQREDLEESLSTLSKTLERINRQSRQLFQQTLERTRQTFNSLVERLFLGGRGEIVSDGGPEPGVRILIQPKGKRLRSMELLSRGEKALAAIAFILSLFLLRPAPFCIMDEVDSPLDEANIERFLGLLREFENRCQFILVTHQKRTIEAAHALYGVTMEVPGISKVVSLRLR